MFYGEIQKIEEENEMDGDNHEIEQQQTSPRWGPSRGHGVCALPVGAEKTSGGHLVLRPGCVK